MADKKNSAKGAYVKLYLNYFDKPKAEYAFKEVPNGIYHSHLLLHLIILAGKVQADGRIYISEDIPYTPQSLSNKTGIPVDIMMEGISLFVKFKWLDVSENFDLFFPEWEEDQNTESIQKKKEGERKSSLERVRKHREKMKREKEELLLLQQKLSVSRNGDVTPLRNAFVTVLQTPVTPPHIDIDIELEKEKDLERSSSKPSSSNAAVAADDDDSQKNSGEGKTPPVPETPKALPPSPPSDEPKKFESFFDDWTPEERTERKWVSRKNGVRGSYDYELARAGYPNDRRGDPILNFGAYSRDTHGTWKNDPEAAVAVWEEKVRKIEAGKKAKFDLESENEKKKNFQEYISKIYENFSKFNRLTEFKKADVFAKAIEKFEITNPSGFSDAKRRNELNIQRIENPELQMFIAQEMEILGGT